MMRMTILLMMNFYDTSSSFAISFVIVMGSLHKATAATFLICCTYDDVYIVCENNSYGVYRNDDDSLTDTVTISQNEAGIDTEDRIIKLKKYIANMK